MIFRAITSRVGLVLIVAGLLILFHFYDKGRAVRAAKEGLVSEYEVTSRDAEIARRDQLLAGLQEANTMLQKRIANDELVSEGQRRALEDYTASTPGPADCRIDDRLLGILRDRTD